MTTGPGTGLSSVAWSTPVGVITSIALRHRAGATEQIGLVPPAAQTPKVKLPRRGGEAAGLAGREPVLAGQHDAEAPSPGPGVPNSASGSAIVMVWSPARRRTNAVPTERAAGADHTGAAKPWASTRSLQAPAGAML